MQYSFLAATAMALVIAHPVTTEPPFDSGNNATTAVTVNVVSGSLYLEGVTATNSAPTVVDQRGTAIGYVLTDSTHNSVRTISLL